MTLSSAIPEVVELSLDRRTGNWNSVRVHLYSLSERAISSFIVLSYPLQFSAQLLIWNRSAVDQLDVSISQPPPVHGFSTDGADLVLVQVIGV